MEHPPTPLSRRTVITKLGLGVAGGSAAMFTAGSGATASASDANDPNRGRSGARRGAAETANAAIPSAAGVSYRSYTYGDFHTYAGAPVSVVANFGAYSTDPFVVGLDLPQDAHVVELALWAGATTGVDIRRTNLGEFAWTTVAQATAGSGAGIVFASAPVSPPIPVDNSQHAYGVEVYAHTAATFLTTVRVGYVALGPFHPINPVRVYDSRDATTVPAPLLGGKTRTVSVANASPAFGGQLDVVPPGAQAVTYNLTVTSTVGSGYVGVYPVGGTFSASAINWFASGQTLANAATVALGGDRQVVLQAGGSGSTHVAIDITGYYL